MVRPRAIRTQGRDLIAVIGIDRYRHWPPLKNAVRDASSTAARFGELGFQEVVPPLLDEGATGAAIHALVIDGLQKLVGPEDSLVLFYAGHGGLRTHRLGDRTIETGYLIPVDASSSRDEVATWIGLEGWLRTVALLPAKHILVILDACKSGIALGAVTRWRDISEPQDTSPPALSALSARHSRRIITSALSDQVALDSGPVDGHSLFTGCLIEGLTRGISSARGRDATGSELGLYLQQRVKTYPLSAQTPDFGAFDHDERGEIMIPHSLGRPCDEPPPDPGAPGLELVRVRPGELPAAPPPPPRARPLRPRRMVSWYSPALLRYHQRTKLGARSRWVAPKLLSLLSSRPAEYFDYSTGEDGAPRGELWIDYVSDTGDGFNSTYAVARAVADGRLALRDPAGKEHETERGRVLILGGDLTYPYPSAERYEQQLAMPYEEAAPHAAAPPHDLFAIPGSHDWHDGLVAFTERFCAARWFAAWRTHQRRTYFALQLPHDWWLVGVDVQSTSDIDAEQLAYFQAVAARMHREARVVVCIAEPDWLYATREGRLASNLEYLQERVFQGRSTVSLAGDVHHYRRDSAEGRHRIVAGGGGGFLDATHADPHRVRLKPAGARPSAYVREASYPDVETSRGLARRTLQFLRWNPSFGLLPALLYLLTWATLRVDPAVLLRGAGADAIWWSPMLLGWLPIVLVAAVLFTDASRPSNRVLGGLAHGLSHLAAAVLVGWGASWLAGAWAPALMTSAAASALVFAGGWIAGPCVLGLYLYAALHGFGRHATEAFASLRIEDWKHFLRLHVRRDGTLRIYPVGIDRVPRRWRRDPCTGGGPRLVADDPRATPPALIEMPIDVPRA